jgi:hypothetical protein
MSTVVTAPGCAADRDRMRADHAVLRPGTPERAVVAPALIVAIVKTLAHGQHATGERQAVEANDAVVSAVSAAVATVPIGRPSVGSIENFARW